MNKIYVVTSEVVTYDDFNSRVEGLFISEDKAKERLTEVIESLCLNQKESLESDYEDEAADLEYDSFDEYWEEWINGGFVAPNFWRFNDDDMTIVVSIVQKTLED